MSHKPGALIFALLILFKPMSEAPLKKLLEILGAHLAFSSSMKHSCSMQSFAVSS
jgi:hypothetical protein